MQSMLWILSVTPVPVGKALGIKRCQGPDKWTHFCNFVGDDLGIVKQISFWRIGDWTFCYMPITNSISQLIEGVSFVFGRLFMPIGHRSRWAI